MGIKPPREWEELLGKEIRPSWKEWVGEHFLNILKTPSAPEYEDIVSEVFKALGFDVEQMGYRREGEYPDGIIHTAEYSIVYDCKNQHNYFITAMDKRAMTKYIQYAKKRIKEKRGIEKVYFAFTAHSFDEKGLRNLSIIERETSTKSILLTSETLLYLLYKKLSFGYLFLLADFEELIAGQIVTKEEIDKIWKKSA